MTSPYLSSTSHSPDTNRSAHSSNAATSGSTSTLRPRNRRLISTELTSPGPDAKVTNTNRALSPIPSRHPSRIASAQRAGGGFGKGLWEGGLTGSWTALQGLASSVLGVEVGDSLSEGVGAAAGRKGGDAGRARARASSAAKKVPATWGPSGSSSTRDGNIGAGSAAARDLALKVTKTASVLESHERVNGGLDLHGNYKRRTSMDGPDTPGQLNEDEDALVYVHHVQPQDTLAGVVLKYNCQPTVFRKANRLWPNDVIQVRKVVLLPVDACAIKGRPCDPPKDNQPMDLLALTPDTENASSGSTVYTNGGSWRQKLQDSDAAALSSPSSPSHKTPYTDNSKAEVEEESWVHVRWVLLDSSPSSKPVEIARLPRKALGYFPPRRRKSQATTSSISTPRGSLDLHHIPQLSQETSDGAANALPQRGRNLGLQSSSRSYFPPQTSKPTSQRESKVSRRNNFSETGVPPNWLRGPGGVGTLAKDVRSPGPAEDSFNAWASKHIPILGIGYLPSSSAMGAEIASFGFNDELRSIAEGLPAFPAAAGSGMATPTGQGMGMGLEQAAASIEGWLRRLATKAPGTPNLGMGMGSGHKATPELGDGDLIELLDGAGSDDGKGFAPTIVSSGSRPIASRSGREDLGSKVRSPLPAGAGAKGKSD